MASGGLDEDRIAALLAARAPIDGFGVGSRLGVSADAPYLDCAYKLVEYAGRGTMKLSPGKSTLPGAKQVWRTASGDVDVADVVALRRERQEQVPALAGPARPLLEPVMRGGERLPAGRRSLDEARERCRAELARLPERIRALEPAEPPYPVTLSPGLRTEAHRLEGALRRG